MKLFPIIYTVCYSPWEWLKKIPVVTLASSTPHKTRILQGWFQHRVNFHHSQQDLHLHTHEAAYLKLQWCQICCDTSDLWKGFWLSAILDYKEIGIRKKKRENDVKCETIKICWEDEPAPSKCNAKTRWEGIWVSHEIKPTRFSKNICRWSRI